MGAFNRITWTAIMLFVLKLPGIWGCFPPFGDNCGPSPVHGGWGEWGNWDSCGGVSWRHRHRQCDNPSPRHGGSGCEGSNLQYEDCNECAYNNGGCDHYCDNTIGSYKCYCYSEKYKLSDWHTCSMKTCKISDLPFPLQNGVLGSECAEKETVNVDTRCTVTCLRGYQLNGQGTNYCGSDETWTHKNIPQCSKKLCVKLETPSHGTIRPPLCTSGIPLHGDNCQFECKDGYTLYGHREGTCDDGVWTSSIFTCKDEMKPTFGETCPPDVERYADEGKSYATVSWVLPRPKDNDGLVPRMSVSPSGLSPPDQFGEGVHLVAYTATDAAGNKKDCTFHVKVAVLRCPVLDAPKNGKLSDPSCGNKFGSICRFECTRGFNIKGSTVRRCVKQGYNDTSWTGSTTTCEIVRCPPLPASPHASVTGLGCNGSVANYSTACQFNCKLGYERVNGSRTRTCTADGQWSGSKLLCKAITCEAITNKPNAPLIVHPPSCIANSSAYGTECKFSCKDGYKLFGPGVKTCTQSSKWFPDNANSWCKDIAPPIFKPRCPSNIFAHADESSTSAVVLWEDITATDNSGAVPNVTHFGRTSGSRFPEGHHQVKYIAADLANNIAECVFKVIITVIRCIPPLFAPASGSMSCDKGNIYGSTCTFKCAIGHNLRGSTERTCEAKNSSSSGFWTGNKTECAVIQCPKLHPISHSTKSGCVSGKDYNTFGDACHFRCNPGYYQVNGSRDRRCNANGNWSGTPLECQIFKCQGLKPPESGQIHPQQCNMSMEYRSTCHFSCNKGYRLHGSSIVTCLENGQWSKNDTRRCEDIERPSFKGTCPYNIYKHADRGKNYTKVTWPKVEATDNSGKKPTLVSSGLKDVYYQGKHVVQYNATDDAGNTITCRFEITVEVIHCPKLLAPIMGLFAAECKDTYGSTCSFRCHDGYKLYGSTNRSCEVRPGYISGYWTGSLAYCKVQSCYSLKVPGNGYVYPHMCSFLPVSGTNCTFGCYYGFQPSKDSVSHLTCGPNGQWNKNISRILTCRDVTRPTFGQSCVADIRVSLGHNSTAIVNWTEPFATDNSDVLPRISVSPPDAKPPYSVNETILITYTATDGAGNTAQCSFKIILEDNAGPQVVFCPPSQNITATTQKTKVEWDEPQFNDNSGGPLTITCSHNSGATFFWGEWNIYCRAYDKNPANVPAVCHFVLNLQPKKCPIKTPPKNGAMACDDWQFGRYCSPFCNNQWDFTSRLPMAIWVCDAKGKWVPPFPWPDCTKKSNPNAVKMENRLHYYSGDCNQPETRLQIQRQFIQLLNESAFNIVCQDPLLKDKCKAENVRVTCYGARRKRRSIDQPTVEIEFEMSVEMAGLFSHNNRSIEEVCKEATNILRNISQVLRSAIQEENLTLSLNGTLLEPDKQSFNSTEPAIVCLPGQYLKDDQYCLSCTNGTYLDKDAGECLDCPKGSYQDKEAQDFCYACPNKTSTSHSRAQNASFCKALCQPGFYSSDGLEPCLSCEKGSYQDRTGQSTCRKCVGNTTTSKGGSSSVNDCAVPCNPGTFSPSGLHPCQPCDKRSYQPAPESRSCIRCPGTTISLHNSSTSRQDCIEINECLSDPCTHGSTCIDQVGDYFCSCPIGFTGKRCQVNIDDCAQAPCRNNGTCHDQINNFTCTCAAGYTGEDCAVEIDECASDPCKNNATCEDLVDAFQCLCSSGFAGEKCEKEINECDSSPCWNNGNCTDQLNSYTCQCSPGYSGANCEEDIDDCASDPCTNGALCTDGRNSFTCNCIPGYTGQLCETDINECSSNPCMMKNSTCIDDINGFTCLCPPGFDGPRCQNEIDECQRKPCQNGASCLDGINSYSCQCQAGYDGINCDNNIDDCAAFPCSNDATCTDGIKSYTCVCPAGYTGQECNIDINECESDPCENNGTCHDKIDEYICQCIDGFEGKLCEINIDDCALNKCLNGGTCIDQVDAFKCECMPGYVGVNCEINFDDCNVAPCLNNGNCKDLTNDYSCDCTAGYFGKNCSVDINECSSSPCLHNGTCSDAINGFTCDCAAGFTGLSCETNINECSNHSCANGSTCVDEVNSYSCTCAAGFNGQYCQDEIDECDSFPCSNGATCIDKINAFSCTCRQGFTGQTCDVNIDDCKDRPCQNGGLCEDRVGNYTCVCPQGYYGTHCEHIIDYCATANCSNNSKCENSPQGFNCKCSHGYMGSFCDMEVDECSSDPCLTGSTCVDGRGNFTCKCPAGFTGILCNVNINDCINNSCVNNASCVDHVLGYSCLCSDGFNGTFCEKEINECDSHPCLNNGTCTDLVADYRCKCPDKFNGHNCQNYKDICRLLPCHNNGTCKADNSSRGFSCNCLAGFTGDKCETNINECASMPCVLNSYCVDLDNGYKCQCFPTHTGENCDIPLGSDFDLRFKRRSTEDMVLLDDGVGIPNMRSVTVAMFVKADSSFKTGTLFTYSVPGKPKDTFTISFTPSHVVVTLKNTVLKASQLKFVDNSWHFLGAVWDGMQNSTLSLYIDGLEVEKVQRALVPGEELTGGGWITLGQHYTANLSTPPELSQSFVGSLHQVSMWNVPATKDHMWNAAHNCTWPIGGSVKAWINFLLGTKGQIQRIFPTKCKALQECTTNCSHFDACEARRQDYYCKCARGFTGGHCNINIDECASNPCVHGTCIDDINSYRCVCKSGFWGKNCDQVLTSKGKECEKLKNPINGKATCKPNGGRILCTLTCDEGFAFKEGSVVHYGCGPDTGGAWNNQKSVELPRCSRLSPPVEIRTTMSVTFPSVQCNSVANAQAIQASLTKKLLQVFSENSLGKCFDFGTCVIEKMEIPNCPKAIKSRKKRSPDQGLDVLFSLILREYSHKNDSSFIDTTEQHETALFQLRYVVSTGQLSIPFQGKTITAKRTSFKQISAHYSCMDGYIIGGDGQKCVACPRGTFYDNKVRDCINCGEGTYQDVEGQTSCKICQNGHEQCYHQKKTEEDEGNNWTFIAVGVSAAVLAIIILAIILLYYSKCCKFVRERKDNQEEAQKEAYYQEIELEGIPDQKYSESKKMEDKVASEYQTLDVLVENSYEKLNYQPENRSKTNLYVPRA